MNYYGLQFRERPIVFNDTLAANTSRRYEYELTGDGQITKLNITFATGENGTLHIHPYVILNGNITQELVNYGGNKYIAGDGEKFELESYQPIERHAKIVIDADNVGASASMVDVAVIVAYNDNTEEKTVVGFDGRGLNGR